MADFEEPSGRESDAADIRAQLGAAFEAAETPETPPTPEPTAKPEPTTQSDRQRDETGKFVAREGDRPQEKVATEAKPATEPAEKPATADDPVAKATARWSEADKATLAALPEQGRELVLRRVREQEADYTRKTQQLAEERQQITTFRNEYEPVAQIFAPYANMLRQHNVTPASIIQTWHNVERQLLSGGPDAINAVHAIVRQYNIDTSQVARALGIAAQPGAEAPQTGAQLPPEIMQRMTQTERWIAQQEQRRQQQEQHAQRQAESKVVSDIDQFAAETAADGSLAHPHFRELENEIARLAMASRAATGTVPPLSELYETAVWANPSTRIERLAAQRAAEKAQHDAAEAKRQQEARAKAEQSRRAGASVIGAPGGNIPASTKRGNGTGSVREDLVAAMEDMDTAA